MLTRRKTLFRFCCYSCDEFRRKLNAQMPHQTMTTVIPYFHFAFTSFLAACLPLPHALLVPHALALTPFEFAAFALMMVLIFFQHYNSTSRDTLCTTKRLAGVFVIVILLYYYILCFVFLNFLFLSLRAGFCCCCCCPSSHTLCIVCFSFILTLLSPNE